MSFNARWRGVKIVEPDSLLGKEIIGGIGNALERGEPIIKVRQSFINAGYNPLEVDSALKEVLPTRDPRNDVLLNQRIPQQEKEIQIKKNLAVPKDQLKNPLEKVPLKEISKDIPVQRIPKPILNVQKRSSPINPNSYPSQNQTYKTLPKNSSSEKSSRWIIIVILILITLILIGAALLGLFWDKLFGV